MLHVVLFSGPSPLGVNYSPRVELIAKGHKFYICLYSEIFRNLTVPNHKALAYQVLYIAVSSGPLPRVPKLLPMDL